MRLYYTLADNVQSCMLKNTPQNIQFKKHGFGQQEELCMDNGSYMKTMVQDPYICRVHDHSYNQYIN
jgi:hypothetical protein